MVAAQIITNDLPYLTGWLSPEGRLYPCDSAEHKVTAQEILADVYGGDDGSWPYDQMYKKRFVHISYSCSCDMGHDEFLIRPTTAQRHALNELANLASSEERNNILYFLEK